MVPTRSGAWFAHQDRHTCARSSSPHRNAQMKLVLIALFIALIVWYLMRNRGGGDDDGRKEPQPPQPEGDDAAKRPKRKVDEPVD